MADLEALKAANLRARDWLFTACWPLWSDAGADPRGGFREKLTLDGTPIEEPDTRARVQARQTYVYCAAARMGYAGAGEAVRHGVACMLDGRRPDGLYGLRITPGAGISKDGADLYDQAFVLFALSHAYDVLKDGATADAARQLFQSIETHMKRPDSEGGYFEELGAGPIRQQNHHMHLFEAFLAAFDHLGDPACLEAARGIDAFVTRALIDPGNGAMHELAEPGTGRWPDDDRFEAGHQFEWVWLLGEARRLGITDPHIDASKLLAAGRNLTNLDGRAVLSHALAGDVRQPVFRSWVQTEALKAYLSAHENGDSEAAAEAVRCVDLLFEDHLLANGGWIDQLNTDLTPKSDTMPASTGYHVVLAFEELDRVVRTSA